MKNKKYYKRYWKRIFGYEYKSEYRIYKFLCGELKWGEKRKVPVDKRFKTYSEWKVYLKLFYKSKELCELKEFYRYLNCLKRVAYTSNNFYNAFLMPFVVALLAGSIAPKLLELKLPNINYNEIIDQAQISWVQQITLLVLIIILVIVIFILLLIIIVLPLTFFIISFFNRASDNKLEADFYEDYMEIINEIIEEKERQRKAFNRENGT